MKYNVSIDVLVEAPSTENAVHKARCALGIYTSFRDHSIAESVECAVFDEDGHYKVSADLDNDLIVLIS